MSFSFASWFWSIYLVLSLLNRQVISLVLNLLIFCSSSFDGWEGTIKLTYIRWPREEDLFLTFCRPHLMVSRKKSGFHDISYYFHTMCEQLINQIKRHEKLSVMSNHFGVVILFHQSITQLSNVDLRVTGSLLKVERTFLFCLISFLQG